MKGKVIYGLKKKHINRNSFFINLKQSNPIPINVNTWQIRNTNHIDDSTQFDPGK